MLVSKTGRYTRITLCPTLFRRRPANNEFMPGFATALTNKDLALAMDAVKSTGSAAPLGSHAAEIYAMFAAENADKDLSAVIEMLRGS